MLRRHRAGSSTRTRVAVDRRRRRPAREITRRQDRHRGRHQAGPADHGRLRRRDHRRLRPDPGHGQGAVVDGGGRRRRDRHRVRLDVRRARHQGHRGREAADRCSDFCDKEIVEALKYQLRDLAVTFRFSETVAGGAEAPGRHADHPGVAARRSRPTPCCTRPAGRASPTSSNIAAAGLQRQQPRPDRGQRELPDRGRAHLRRRRRHRLPGAGRHRDGTGPARHLPRVRRAGRQQARRPAADRHLHDPRDLASSAGPRTS